MKNLQNAYSDGLGAMNEAGKQAAEDMDPSHRIIVDTKLSANVEGHDYKVDTHLEFLADLKAAVRLGHPQAVQIALANLRALPQIASNEQISASQITQLIRPAGNILVRLPSGQLLPLLEDPLAALRAVGAVAVAHQFFKGQDVDQGTPAALFPSRRNGPGQHRGPR